MKTFKLAASLFILALMAHSCEKEDLTKLPPETQEGKNTFGCYVNGELFVAQRGYSTTFGAPYLYAEYMTRAKVLEIWAYGKKGKISFNILKPNENLINTSFIVYATINEQGYQGYNYFAVYDTITKEFNDVIGNQKVGEINFTNFDTINEIVSGNFHCNMGTYDKDKPQDININTYVLDSIANISHGRFDLIMRVNNN